jgi:hypothetical protein
LPTFYLDFWWNLPLVQPKSEFLTRLFCESWRPREGVRKRERTWINGEHLPGVIRQKIKQTDLAAMAGIARENVARILNDWERRKLMSHLSGYYCLEDKAQLEHQVKI